MAKCLERPLDVCCMSCMKDHPLLSTKECIFPYCEPLRRYFDFRVMWKRPFLTCVLFGCCFGLVPALVILGTLLMSYLIPGDLNNQILSSNCESVAAWTMLEFIFCIINFMFTCWIFGELKKPEEERDHCYERDMTELYRRYLVYQYPHLLQEMKLLEESYKLAKKQIAEQKEALKIEIEELKSEVSDLQGAASIATKDEATSVQEKKAIATKKLKEAEKSLMRLDSGSDDSLTDRLKTVFGSDKTCSLFGLLLLCGFVWTIIGSLFLKGNKCENSLLMMSARIMVYSVYIFIVLGLGVCFCNAFAVSEISLRSRGTKADLSEVELLLNAPARKEKSEVTIDVKE